jgi:hypothetical protein
MRLFNFTNIFNKFEEYEVRTKELKEMVLEDFSKRKDPAKIQIGAQIIDATIGRVLINLLIMRPFVEKDVVLTEDFIFGFESVTEKNLNKYFNQVIAKGKTVVDFDNLRQSIAETINEMSDLSGKLNVLAGNSISFHDFVRLYSEDQEARNIFNYKLKSSMQFDEIEDEFNKLGHTIEDFFLSRPDTELYPFMTADTGINKKQLTQAIGFIGLKPDIDGSIIPVAIEANYLTGLGSIQNYFINAKGTRKALITNAKQVRKSGYLTRKLSLALIDRYHDHDHEDCGTHHFVNYVIDTQQKLDQIQGRHYYLLDSEGKKSSELLTIETNDTSLIGKTIGLRSPVTCAAVGHVCRICYGSELSKINEDINTGLLAVLLLTNPLTQKLLSAKHLLTTNAQKIDWNEKKPFLDYFSINMNSIYIKDPDTDIIIHKAVNDDQDEEDIGDYTEKIEIIHQGKKMFTYKAPDVKLYYTFSDEKDDLEDEEIDDNEDDDTINTMKTIKIKGTDFEEGEPVFTFLAKNNELTKSLQQILDLIESSQHLFIVDYHDLVNTFNTLIIENGLEIKSIHSEMISSVLVVDKETGKKVDFSNEKIGDYDILRVSNTVLNGPLAKSLAFERLPEQFINLKTYEKDEESLMDYLYQ